MSFWQIVLVAGAGGATVFFGMIGTLIVIAKVEKYWAANGGRFPWQK